MSDSNNRQERANKSPINKSRAKMMFSFSKSQRFDEIKLQGSKTFTYELPNLKNRRSTSLGYGKKFDFVIKHINQKAPYYDIPSDFNEKKPNSPAFSFGIARHFYDKVFEKTGKILDRNIPGPGRYDHQKPLGSDALKFSLFGRRGGTKIFDKILENPGPGEYDSIKINLSGKYPVSSFRNTTNNISWANYKETRFNNKKNAIPGPGTYNPKSLIDGSGSTFISRYKSSTAKSLGGRIRELSNKNQTPGPGSYSTFSEFGLVESKNAKKERESSKTFYDKRSQYLSERKSLSNGFIKLSKSEKFNRDYRDDSEKPLTNYMKYFENDEEKILSKTINTRKDITKLKSSEYDLRFDNPEPEKKTQHISELDIKQNDDSENKNQNYNDEKNNKKKEKKQSDKGSSNNNFKNFNNIVKSDISNNMSKHSEQQSKNYFENSIKSGNVKNSEKSLNSINQNNQANNDSPIKLNYSKKLEYNSPKDNLSFNKKDEKTEEHSKILGADPNYSKSINSKQNSIHHDKEEFLRKTENSVNLSKKIKITNNIMNDVTGSIKNSIDKSENEIKASVENGQNSVINSKNNSNIDDMSKLNSRTGSKNNIYLNHEIMKKDSEHDSKILNDGMENENKSFKSGVLNNSKNSKLEEKNNHYENSQIKTNMGMNLHEKSKES